MKRFFNKLYNSEDLLFKYSSKICDYIEKILRSDCDKKVKVSRLVVIRDYITLLLQEYGKEYAREYDIY